MPNGCLTFYGREQALSEGWEVRKFPGSEHLAHDESNAEMHRFRCRGAVVVEIEEIWSDRGIEVECREYALGLPPADVDVDLRKLAHHAGMLGEQPETLRWRPPE